MVPYVRSIYKRKIPDEEAWLLFIEDTAMHVLCSHSISPFQKLCVVPFSGHRGT